jgi:predicted AlkP superfamily phosphohydrolase/phosphomutase
MTPGVIVFGVDGLDPIICREMMADGRLPALSRLASQGAFLPLRSIDPPQSPVVWGSMATSTNPGRHGLFDFLHRNPDNYLVELAILKHNPRNYLGRGSSMFLPVLKGQTFWDQAAAQGQPATVLRWPVTFPAAEGPARLLTGLGTPDIKGGLGRYGFYTDSRDELSGDNKGDQVLVQFKNDLALTKMEGPKTSSVGSGKSAVLPLEIRLHRDRGAVILKLGPDQTEVKIGRFSPWLRPVFSVGVFSKIRALCRFYLTGLDPLRLYLTPLEIDPWDPAFPISCPEDFAAHLAENIGPFETLGIPEDTNALVDGRLDEKAFLESCDQIMSTQEKMLNMELDNFEQGLLANVFFTSDRLQHIFWVTRDPDHPAFSTDYTREFGRVIPDLYRRLDAALGRVLSKAAAKRAAVLVCSDHGFNTYRTNVHLNTWLVEQGLMTLKGRIPVGDTEGGPLFRYVDWSRTRAYALGFNTLYLNLKGREKNGVVAPGREASDLCQKIAAALTALRDGAGRPVVTAARLGRDLYHGEQLALAPDLVVGYHPGYRASWQTALGGTPNGPLYEDNLKKWTGDHLFDAAAVPGCLFTSFQVKNNNPTILDIGPTALSLLGLKPTDSSEGQNLA